MCSILYADQGNMVHAVETGLFGERAKKATPEIVAAIRAEYIPYDREHSTMQMVMGRLEALYEKTD